MPTSSLCSLVLQRMASHPFRDRRHAGHYRTYHCWIQGFSGAVRKTTALEVLWQSIPVIENPQRENAVKSMRNKALVLGFRNDRAPWNVIPEGAEWGVPSTVFLLLHMCKIGFLQKPENVSYVQ